MNQKPTWSSRAKTVRTVALNITVICLLLVPVAAETTNRIFVSPGDSIFFNRRPLNPAEEAERIRESRPAEDDPEGNWGFVAEGFQLSLRFEKTTFAVGEPIVATILFRNVSDKRLEFSSGHGYGIDSYYGNFVVIRDPRILIPRIPTKPYGGSGLTGEMEPGTQARDKVRLDTLYDLSAPGSYLVYVKHRAFRENGSDIVDLLSGNASINIIGSPKTAGRSDKEVSPPSKQVAPPTVGSASVPRDSQGNLAYYVEPTPPPGPFFSTSQNNKRNLKTSLEKVPRPFPSQLAQAETGAGWSSRDKMYGLLVLGLLLGLGWYLFRARSPQPKR